MTKTDITSSIERMPNFEERLGIRLEALSAFLTKDDDDEHYDVHVRGEMHASTAGELDDDIELTLSVHDSEGRVIETDSHYFDSDKFYGFDTFDLWCQTDSSKISKLRLVPKKA